MLGDLQSFSGQPIIFNYSKAFTGNFFLRKLVILTVRQYKKLVNDVLMKTWANHNYHDSDIDIIPIAIVIKYGDIPQHQLKVTYFSRWLIVVLDKAKIWLQEL